MSSLFKVFRKELTWAGKKLVIETGKIARQADAAVTVSYGDTTVLCTVVAAKSAGDQDFFPLTVNYQEKFYATGRIPGGFFKREGRPTEQETLVSRLIDRPIRPLFPDFFRNETQVICTTLSMDRNIQADIPAIIGASAALTLSGIPFMGPIGAARVGFINGEYVINPTVDEMKDSSLDLVLAGTNEGVLMVESEAKELTEEQMLEAVSKGHESFQPVLKAIIDLAETCAKDPWAIDLEERDKTIKPIKDKIEKLAKKDFASAYKLMNKQERSQKLDEIRTKISEAFSAELEAGTLSGSTLSDLTKKLEADIVRTNILETKKRIDGRGLADIRPIEVEAGFLPKVHGSALFTRGETQAICVTTLGTAQDMQLIDAIEGEYEEDFMLHYNFPPFSVGETGRLGSPGRREIGHGKLAWRAIHPLLPGQDKFPYTIRIVSEITESNGSSSMATVCASSLSMMDAGVPLPKPVAGIAMGLIKESKDFAVLSDILGDEDHLGDMDFKVAGTKDGITSLQMDIKITSITRDIMEIALKQAKEGRAHILKEMSKALDTPRKSLSKNAPTITTIKIPVDKIREVIGSGGKVIREICEKSGAKVDINDDGVINVAAVDGNAADKAIQMINDIIAEAEVGKIYKGKVEKIVDFGAFVGFLGGCSGLVHISQIKPERVEKVSDVLSEGQEVFIKVIGFDHRGKIKLSMKVVNQETGEELKSNDEEEAA